MVNKEDVINTWNKVFPKSKISVGGNTELLMCRGYLAKDKTEVTNGYFENDVLNYGFTITDGVFYAESGHSMYIRPESGTYCAYSIAKIRAKSLKGVTTQSLEKRFNDIKKMVLDNKDVIPETKLHYDINDKFLI